MNSQIDISFTFIDFHPFKVNINFSIQTNFETQTSSISDWICFSIFVFACIWTGISIYSWIGKRKKKNTRKKCKYFLLLITIFLKKKKKT